MNVIRHDHKFIQGDARNVFGEEMPGLYKIGMEGRLCKEALAFLGTDGDEIGAFCCIVIAREAERSSMVKCWIEVVVFQDLSSHVI